VNEILATFQLDFMRNALICGLLMAPLMGLLGSFVVLRGLSFFGEAIGHSTIAGVGIAMLLGLNPTRDPALFLIVLVGLSLVAAFAIRRLEALGALKTDTSIAIVYATMVAGGNLMIARATDGNTSAVMMDVMFGSILLVSRTDVVVFAGLLLLLVIFLARHRAPLTIMTLQPEYARAIGIRTDPIGLMFLALLTMAVATSVRIMGAVLVTALLVLPAAAARNAAFSLRSMLALAVVAALIALEGGMVASVATDLPTGSTIIVLAAVLFAISLVIAAHRRRSLDASSAAPASA